MAGMATETLMVPWRSPVGDRTALSRCLIAYGEAPRMGSGTNAYSVRVRYRDSTNDPSQDSVTAVQIPLTVVPVFSGLDRTPKISVFD
eukprot:gene1634-biopygen11026